MAYNRRPPRRQGVVYGPPRSTGRYSDNGVLIGRLLGLGILLLTLGVLAAGALAFVGDRAGQVASPARSAVVAASFSFFPPTLSPTIAISPPATTILPTITPGLPSAPPSVPASLPPPLVQIGKGYVTFGTESDAQLHIVDPRSTFALVERIVWSAYLRRPANSIDLRLQILKLDAAAEAGERLILEEPVMPLVRNAQIFGHGIRPEMVLEGAGIYVVRYLRADNVLSQGSFQVTA